MEVSKNIRAIRESKGLTQVDMANRMNTERSNYARLENRDVNLTLKQIQEISDALEVTIYDIIGMPQVDDLRGKQSETLQRLQEKLQLVEEALRDKKRNIKLYKSFIEWTRDKFVSHLNVAALYVAEELGLRDRDLDTKEIERISSEGREFSLADFNFTQEELRTIGDHMFSPAANDYLLNGFIAEFGFISEKWFTEAFKRKNRRAKESFAYSEVRNWVNGVFEFLEEE